MKQTGLTLIELVVIIATVTLFIAVFLPSLQNSKDQAKAILCATNIKDLMLGLFVYETTNGTLPYGLDSIRRDIPPGGYPGDHTYDRMGWWWFNYIHVCTEESNSKKGVLWCPSRQINNSKLKRDVLCGNYGVNQSICKSSHGRKTHAEFIGRPLRTSDMSSSGQTLLLVDSGYAMVNWWHATNSPPVSLSTVIEDGAYLPGLWINKERELWPGQEWDAINGRHLNKTVNVGFVDGHVGCAQADDFCVKKADEGYKNLRPLWLPR